MNRTLTERLGSLQRKLRTVTGVVPVRKLPLLTPAEAFGPDLERFRDTKQSIVSWRNKQEQWWQFCGFLKNTHGRPYAFNLRFIDRRTQNDYFGALPTRWITPRAFAAHFAVTDPMNAEPQKNFRYWQRGGLFSTQPGFAADDRFHVELDGWSAYRAGGDKIILAAHGDGESLHLELEPIKPLTFHGQSGYVHIEKGTREATFYCSQPRMRVTGRFIYDERLEEVSGIAWMDHEKFTGGGGRLEPDANRLFLQFESGEELLIYENGRTTFGTWINASGEARHLIDSEIAIETVEYWISPRTKARYPVKRNIRIEALNLDLHVRPVVLDQEMDTIRTTFQCSWEGTVSAQNASGFMRLVGRDPRPRTKILEFLLT